MPTDAGIVTRENVTALLGPSHIFSGITRGLAFTIEQFAEALRGECSGYCWCEEADSGILCTWCKHRKELLAAYDGEPVDS